MTNTLVGQGEQHDEMNEKELQHLAGVIDAAAGITVSVGKSDRYNIGYQYQPIIRLYRQETDAVLVGKLMEYADEEGVKYDLKERESADGVRYEFTVRDTESIKSFLLPLRERLVARYEEAMLMLDVVIPAVEANEHHTKQGLYQLMGPADRLRSVKHSGPDPKYTQDYFADLWADEIEEGASVE